MSTVLARLRRKLDMFANSLKMAMIVGASFANVGVTVAVSSANACVIQCGNAVCTRRNSRSATIANNNGDRGQPCLTPLVAVKLGNVLPFTFTKCILFVYRCCMACSGPGARPICTCTV